MREGGGGNRTERRGAFHTPHWVWKGRRVQTQSSLCALCYAGEKREGTDGKSKWLDHWKLEKQDKCHYQFRLSCFLTCICSRRGFSGPPMFARWLMSACAQSNQIQQLKNTNSKWYFGVLFSGFWDESATRIWNANLFPRWIAWQGCDAKAGQHKNRPVSKCFFFSSFFFLLHLFSHSFSGHHTYNLWEKLTKKNSWVTEIQYIEYKSYSNYPPRPSDHVSHIQDFIDVSDVSYYLYFYIFFSFSLTTFLCHACGRVSVWSPYWPEPCWWWKRVAKHWRRVPGGHPVSDWPSVPSDPACGPGDAHCSLTAVGSRNKRNSSS